MIPSSTKNQRRLTEFEAVEERLCLSAMVFTPHDIECCSERVKTLDATDIDGDGDQDVLVATEATGRIYWQENLDGLGSFGPPRLISDREGGPQTAIGADIDGDGDQDVIASFDGRNSSIVWYENIDGAGAFAAPVAITDYAEFPYSVSVVDVDGDGHLDVVSSSDFGPGLAWYKNEDGLGNFSGPNDISGTFNGPTALISADIDGDGDDDLLSASRFDQKIAWYEKSDDSAEFGEQQIINDTFRSVSSVFASDLDGDQDLDVLAVYDFGNALVWLENTDGKGSFGEPTVLSPEAFSAETVHSLDLDGDGDMDILAGSVGRTLNWFENTDGKGAFEIRTFADDLLSYRPKMLPEDFDGDGKEDILVYPDNSYNPLIWIKNLGEGQFGEPNYVSSRLYDPTSVYLSDIDGDGDSDILATVDSSSDIEVVWYENELASNGSFQQNLTNIDSHLSEVAITADIDGDGDQDVISGGFFDAVDWFENVDGAGNFGPRKVVHDSHFGTSAIFAADMDGDGDLDLVTADSQDTDLGPNYTNGWIFWFENLDGKGDFSDANEVSTGVEGVQSLSVADLDGDGFNDILSASRFDNKIAWFKNIDGRGTFSPQQIVSTEALGARSIFTADIDSDGDIDVLSASGDDNKIAWYENDGNGDFGEQRVISTFALNARQVYAADVDGDGDQDVLSASQDSKIAWYENTDGLGTFAPEQIITQSAFGAVDVAGVDFDGDGDLDVVSSALADGRIVWHEQRIAGDVNRDGVFDSSDLVQVFISGEYEDRARYNSVFDEGDWNNDMEFNSADLVSVFQAGHYETGALAEALLSPVEVDEVFGDD